MLPQGLGELAWGQRLFGKVAAEQAEGRGGPDLVVMENTGGMELGDGAQAAPGSQASRQLWQALGGRAGLPPEGRSWLAAGLSC